MSDKRNKNSTTKQEDNTEDLEASMELSKLERPSRRSTSSKQQQHPRGTKSKPKLQSALFHYLQPFESVESSTMSDKRNRNSITAQQEDNAEDLEASMELSKLERPSRHSNTSSKQKQQQQPRGTKPKSKPKLQSSLFHGSERTFVVNMDHSSFATLAADNNSFSTCPDTTTSKSRQSFVTVSDPDVLRMISIARGEEPEGTTTDADHHHKNHKNHNLNNDDASKERQSQIWCFFVCDLVTAVVAMNSIYIVLLVFHLTISFLDSELFGMRTQLYKELPSDDDYDDDLGGLYDDDYDDAFVFGEKDDVVVLDPWAVVRYAKNLAGLLFAVVGIVGALQFRRSLVLASALWHVLYILLSLANHTWIGFVLTIPFCYTTFHLWLALKAGTITRENYRNSEQHCCCCCCCYRYDDDDDDRDHEGP